jgi:hypothetical protein
VIDHNRKQKMSRAITLQACLGPLFVFGESAKIVTLATMAGPYYGGHSRGNVKRPNQPAGETSEFFLINFANGGSCLSSMEIHPVIDYY